jgi:hypothetical protein
MQWTPLCDRRVNLLAEVGGDALLRSFEQPDNLLKLAQHAHLVLKEFLGLCDGGITEARRGDEDAACLAARHQPYEVLRDLRNADPIRVPLHLHQVKLAVDNNHAIDLLDDAFARVPGDVERLLYCDAV